MNIFESIAAIQKDVDYIGKDKQVQSGGTYRYRGVDQVLNTLHPLFAKYKVFAVPEVLEVLFREERQTKSGNAVIYEVLRVKYYFYAEDGTSVSAVVVGEAMDSGDKASNKCMSVAYKYACFQLLSIPTEETTADPDEANEPFAPLKEAVGLTVEEVAALGVGSPEKVLAWLEDHFEKPASEFTQDEVNESVAFIKKRLDGKRSAS